MLFNADIFYSVGIYVLHYLHEVCSIFETLSGLENISALLP